ncbi:hypothetical protein VTL71DRAFT_11318 [Oculimacula yallundae]|uniref:RING-type domain-containing protein n=1 Tax=Oculimacula yallundae TaxID=86028 RepID=A0ABR4CPT2_9HELO
MRASAAEFSPALRREFYGAVVEFGPGVAIIEVKISNESSSLQIKGLKDTSWTSVQTVFDLLGVTAAISSIAMNENPAGTVATVSRFDNPATAQLVLERFASSHLNDSNLTMNLLVNLPKPSEWVQLGGVKISWVKSGSMAFIEYRNNSPRLDELPSTLSQIRTTTGRRIKCIAVPVSNYEKRRHIQSFTLNNLDIDATSAWIEKTLVDAGFGAPKKIKTKLVATDLWMDDNECISFVKGLLDSIGLLESFYSIDSPDGDRVLITAVFCNQGDAQEAMIKLNALPAEEFPETKKLTIHPSVSMKVNIPDQIASALRRKLQSLRVEMQRQSKDTVKIEKEGGKQYTMVKFSYAGESAVADVLKFKTEIEKLLAGTVVSENGVPSWHPWFGISTDAGNYLNWLSSTTKVYVHRSTAKCHLILYGGTYENRRHACVLLMTKINDLMIENAYTIRPVSGKSISDVLDILKPVFDDKIRLVSSKGSSQIKLLGPIPDIRKARLMLHPEMVPHGGECPICLGTPGENSIYLTCGHTYCQECFHFLCSAPSENLLPITCSGIDTSTNEPCTQIISLSLLNERLSPTEFNQVLKFAFDIHIRTHPSLYAFCRTIDCNTIYRRSISSDANPTLTTCITCLQTYDISCGYHHPRRTCAENHDAVDGLDALARNSARLGIRRCPACDQPGELVEGCHHITCRCGQHFCWVCGLGFEGAERTVDHLNEVYGGIGGDQPQVFVDEDEDDEVEGEGGLDRFEEIVRAIF